VWYDLFIAGQVTSCHTAPSPLVAQGPAWGCSTWQLWRVSWCWEGLTQNMEGNASSFCTVLYTVVHAATHLNTVVFVQEATLRLNVWMHRHMYCVRCFDGVQFELQARGHVTLPGLPTGRATVINVKVAKVGTEVVQEALADVYANSSKSLQP
jgi:hypothetical protein